LSKALAALKTVNVLATAARAIVVGPTGITVELTNKSSIDADRVVVAAGAWSTSLAGLPRPLPVRPLRGAILSIPGIRLNDPVYAATGHAYLFPREGRLMVGATSDDCGFNASPSADDADRLVSSVVDLVPGIEHSARGAVLVGLRPITPDGLAIIGAEPEAKGLIYACGHGRNGFLQAPLTAEVVADLLQGRRPGMDISPFSPTRFS
jgi:glycine/D-amino acid oxidase-like deaminating enzyme